MSFEYVCDFIIIYIVINMKRLGDNRQFFNNISSNNPIITIENPENNSGNGSLCLNKSGNDNNFIEINKEICNNPVIDLGCLT